MISFQKFLWRSSAPPALVPCFMVVIEISDKMLTTAAKSSSPQSPSEASRHLYSTQFVLKCPLMVDNGAVKSQCIAETQVIVGTPLQLKASIPPKHVLRGTG